LHSIGIYSASNESFQKTLKYLGYILLFIPFGMFCQNIDFTTKASKNKIVIGETTNVKLEFKFPSSQLIDSVEFQLANGGDSIGNNWELWEKSSVEKSSYENENGEFFISFSQNFTIANFDSGSYTLPPSVAYFNSKKLFSNSLNFIVTLDEIDEKASIKEIKPIREVSIFWYEYIIYFFKEYGLWILLILCITILVIYIIKKYYKKKTNLVTKPSIPIEITLLKNLNAIEEKKYWENGYFKKYYSELSTVLWEFLEYRYEIKTFEKTSAEILESLKWASIPKKYLSELIRFFEISDGVKFAKLKSLEKDNLRAIITLKELIESERLDLNIEKNLVIENE